MSFTALRRASPSSTGATVDVLGEPWSLEPLGEGDAADVTCVSYAAGSERTPHPWPGYAPMPARTRAVIETVVRALSPTRLWVDAFCVPPDPTERAACLSALGSIYARAKSVVVVLSPNCASALERAAASQNLDEAALCDLDAEPWSTRVWTYQEIVNGNDVWFIAEGTDGPVVAVEDLLRTLSYGLGDLERETSAEAVRARFSRLNDLQDVLLDWKVALYLERTAYQVITNMHHREASYSEDQLLAMFGALSPSAEAGLPAEGVPLAEALMRVCEDKGDFSFLYTTAPRSEVAGRTWRPQSVDAFTTVFPWHSYGDGQAGALHPDHLELHGMWVTSPRERVLRAEAWLKWWSVLREPGASPTPNAEGVLRFLRSGGFSGCGDYVATEDGFFFVQEPLIETGAVRIAVATGLRMVPGAPALAVVESTGEPMRFAGVGFYVGPVPKHGETIRIR